MVVMVSAPPRPKWRTGGARRTPERAPGYRQFAHLRQWRAISPYTQNSRICFGKSNWRISVACYKNKLSIPHMMKTETDTVSKIGFMFSLLFSCSLDLYSPTSFWSMPHISIATRVCRKHTQQLISPWLYRLIA